MTRNDRGSDEPSRANQDEKRRDGPNEDTIHYREPGQFPNDERPGKVGVQESFEQSGSDMERTGDAETARPHDEDVPTREGRESRDRVTEEGVEGRRS